MQRKKSIAAGGHRRQRQPRARRLWRRRPERGRRQDQRRQGRPRSAQRPVRRLQGPVRPEQQGRHPDGRRRLQGQVRRQGGRQEHRDRHGRPPEQARHRQHQGAGDVRPRQGRHHPRRADLLGRAGRGDPGQGEEEALHRHRRRHHRADRQVLQQVHVPLGLRHLHARPGHRRDAVTERRQELVDRLPRLRLRPGHEEVSSPPRSRRPAARSSSRSPTPFPNDNFATFITKAGSHQARRHRHHGRRRRPGQLRQAVQPGRAAATRPRWPSA